MTELHHDADGVAARPVVLVIASVFGVVLLALAVIGFAYDLQLGRPPYESATAPSPPFPSPGLELAPRAELARWQKRQALKLHQSGRVPLEQAMRQIELRGGRAYDALEPGSSETEKNGTPEGQR
jgi:hypothetical protein